MLSSEHAGTPLALNDLALTYSDVSDIHEVAETKTHTESAVKGRKKKEGLRNKARFDINKYSKSQVDRAWSLPLRSW